MVYICHFENKEYIQVLELFSDQSVLWNLSSYIDIWNEIRNYIQQILSVKIDGVFKPCNQHEQNVIARIIN